MLKLRQCPFGASKVSNSPYSSSLMLPMIFTFLLLNSSRTSSISSASNIILVLPATTSPFLSGSFQDGKRCLAQIELYPVAINGFYLKPYIAIEFFRPLQITDINPTGIYFLIFILIVFFFRTPCKPCRAMRQCRHIPCRCIERGVFPWNEIKYPVSLYNLTIFDRTFLVTAVVTSFEVSYKSTREVATLIVISNLFQQHAVLYPALRQCSGLPLPSRVQPTQVFCVFRVWQCLWPTIQFIPQGASISMSMQSIRISLSPFILCCKNNNFLCTVVLLLFY